MIAGFWITLFLSIVVVACYVSIEAIKYYFKTGKVTLRVLSKSAAIALITWFFIFLIFGALALIFSNH